MDNRYAKRLLQEAVYDPDSLTLKAKFWKLAFWPHFLNQCDELLFDDPRRGFALTSQAPDLARKIFQASPGVNGADLMLLAHSYLGGAYRRLGNYPSAEQSFQDSLLYRENASPKALAEHLRRLAYLRLFQKDPECFPLIEEAITIHRKGNLVTRHAFGECLICRGHAYAMFERQGKSLEDFTAALNHLSIKIDPRAFYAALHNLTNWVVEFGTDEQLDDAYSNLRPALTLLHSFHGRKFAKHKLRWLLALIDSRRGNYGRAELVFLEVRQGLVDLKLGYEVGMLSIDLAMMYIDQGRQHEANQLADDTAVLFQRLGVNAKAAEALALWQDAGVQPSSALLKDVRGRFMNFAHVVPAAA